MNKKDIKIKYTYCWLDDFKRVSGIKKKDFKKWRLLELRCIVGDIDKKEKIQILFTNDIKGEFIKKT